MTPVLAAVVAAAGLLAPGPGAPPDVPPAPDAAALAALPAGPGAVPGAVPVGSCPAGVAPAGPGLDATSSDPVPGGGAGQTVAVIDTGVAPHPRLAGRVVDGGDFVAGTRGTTDCDGHGTAVAGVLAASPAPTDLLVGAAPAVRVVAVRQTSAWYRSPAGAGVGDTAGLARAVRHASSIPGVGVLTVALAACLPPTQARTPAVGALHAAVRDATDRGVVVVAAAGNTDGGCGPGTVPVPGWFDDDVLTVGALTGTGAPDPSSRAGPWVDVAAPGRAPVSLDARSAGLTTALTRPGASPSPLAGTSLAVPRVAAVAVALRQRFPGVPAREVAARIVRSAAPVAGLVAGRRSDAVGWGAVDAVAALDGGPPRTGPGVAPPAPARSGGAGGAAAAWTVGALAAAGGALVVVSRGWRRRRRR